MLQRDPDNVPALLRQGRALMMLERPADAARSFSRAVVLQPGSLAALTGLARARTANGENAESVWRDALARAPEDDRLRVGLAISLDLQEKHAEAQVLYRQALSRSPDNPAIRSDLGLSLAMSNQTAEGIALLRQAAQGGFGDDAAKLRRAQNNLVAGLVMAGDDAAARRILGQRLPPAEVTAAMTGLRQFTVLPDPKFH